MAIFRHAASDLFHLAREAARACRRAGKAAVVRRLPVRTRMLDRLGVVPREEFDSVRELAENARRESEQLAERLAKLEAGPRKRTSRKPRPPTNTETPDS